LTVTYWYMLSRVLRADAGQNVRREDDEDMKDDSETWDRTVRTEANGQTVITMVNREMA